MTPFLIDTVGTYNTSSCFKQILSGENQTKILDGSFSSWLVYSKDTVTQGKYKFVQLFLILPFCLRKVCFSPKNHWIRRFLCTWTNFSLFDLHLIHCCWGWQTRQVPQSSLCRVYVDYEKFFKHGVYISILVSICHRNNDFSNILHFIYLQEISEWGRIYSSCKNLFFFLASFKKLYCRFQHGFECLLSSSGKMFLHFFFLYFTSHFNVLW